MIGLALHLAARGLDTVRAEMAEARSLLGWGLAFVALGHGTPDPSEVDQLGAECDALRAERDLARLEHAAAVEVCDELRRRVLDAVDTRERLETSDAAAEETGGIKRLDLLVEAMEAWNKLVEAVTP